MGQEEILNVLSKLDVPITGSKLAELMNEQSTKIYKLLNKLIEQNEINFIEIDRHKALKFLNCKRKLKVYYHSRFGDGYLRRAKQTLPYL